VNKRGSFQLKKVKELEAARKGKCGFCIHKRNFQVGDVTFAHVRCCHPKVIEIQERLPEREPGWIAAKALNEMGKAPNLKVHPGVYESDRWFYWPRCYDPKRPSIVSCSGFEREEASGESGDAVKHMKVKSFITD
jgi:hypothetical protein